MLTEQRIEWIPKGSKSAAFHGLPPQRQRGRRQPELEGKGLLQSRPHRSYLPPNWGCQLLTTSSRHPGRLTSSRSVTAWDQLPRGDKGHPGNCDHALVEHPGTWVVRTWEVHETQLTWDRVLTKRLVTWAARMEGGHKMHSPSGPGPLWSTREPERLRPGKCMKCRVHVGQCPRRAPWSLSSVDLGSTHCFVLWQAQCVPSAESTSRTHQWCSLWRPSLSTAQLNKWAYVSGHFAPLCQGGN